MPVAPKTVVRIDILDCANRILAEKNYEIL